MTFTYVGLTPRQLESGRPLVFGDVLDSLTPADEESLARWLVSNAPDAPAPPVAPPAPEPEPPVTPTSEVT